MAAAMQAPSADRKSSHVAVELHAGQLNRKQLDRIGERLRQMYARFEDEPFSPRLHEALERLTGQSGDTAPLDAPSGHQPISERRCPHRRGPATTGALRPSKRVPGVGGAARVPSPPPAI